MRLVISSPRQQQFNITWVVVDRQAPGEEVHTIWEVCDIIAQSQAIMYSVSSSDMKLYESFLHGDMEGVSSLDAKLYYVACGGDIEGVIAALVQGGRVTVRDPKGFTPLLIAAQYGHTDICGLLLAHGSNVNEVHPITKHTALHFTALRGHNASKEALLSWGAEVNQQDHIGFTPLHLACQEGHLICVLTLLKAGASLTSPNNDGNLPIHIAAQFNRVEIVRTLLERGCSPDMVRS